MFLRCFLHFKDNIKRELTSRGLDEKVRKQFVEEIFGKQEGNVKFYGLVDCNSEDEFETKLEALKEVWEEREKTSGSKGSSQLSFYNWFRKEKVWTKILYHDEVRNLQQIFFSNIKKLCKASLFDKNDLKDLIVLCQVNSSRVDASAHVLSWSRLPITPTFKRNRKKFDLWEVRVIGSSMKIAESQETNSFYCTVNI